MLLKLEEVEAQRSAEAARLQREVDHLRGLQTAALAAGSYKGRQMLYMDSLKAPVPRANDGRSLERAKSRSSMSWRDGSEVEQLYASRDVEELANAAVGEYTTQTKLLTIAGADDDDHRATSSSLAGSSYSSPAGKASKPYLPRGPSASSLVPNETFEAFGETFESKDLGLMGIMYRGREDAMGEKGHLHSSTGRLLE